MIDEEIGMPAKRELSMRPRHLLRLHHDGVSAREIGRRLGVARSTIQDNLKRAAAAGLKWPLADDVTEEALELQLFGARRDRARSGGVEPDIGGRDHTTVLHGVRKVDALIKRDPNLAAEVATIRARIVGRIEGGVKIKSSGVAI